MDSLLASSSLDSRVVYESSWNKYRIDGDLSNFYNSGKTFNPELSLLSSELIELQEELYQKVESISSHTVFPKIFKELNPFRTHLNSRNEDRNGTYYSLLHQHLRKPLLPNQDGKIITNDARVLHFCKETKSKVLYLSPYESKLNKTALSYDDQFRINYKNLHPRTHDGKLLIQDLDFKGDDWNWDFYEDAEGIEADLIILRESSEGRDKNAVLEKRGPFVKDDDQHFRQEHFEVSINAISQLKSGGNLVVQFISLGSQHVADLVYFYGSVFDEIEFYMPMASDFLSMEHYLICRGFKKEFYDEVTGEVLLDLMENWKNPFGYPYYPKMSKFDEDLPFLSWVRDLNDKMMNYHIGLLLSLIQAYDDVILSGYPEVRYPFALDPYKLKLSLNLLATKEINSNNEVFGELDQIDWKSREKELTETGQISKTTGLPAELGVDGFNYRFCLYLSFQRVIADIQPNPELLEYSKNKNIIPSWFLDLLYDGSLQKILSSSSLEEQRTHYKSWQYEHWFLLPEFSSKPIKLELLDETFVLLRNYINGYYNNREALLKVTTLSMTKTKTMKYRVQFSINDKSYLLQSPGDPRLVITQRQLLGIIPNSYKTSNNFSLSLLDGWIKERKFIVRVLNLLSLPIFSANYSNSVSFHRFVDSANIDFDLCATPWIKNGIHWSSFWDEDQSLGALTESQAFDANHPYYQKHPSIKTFWLFPPQKIEIFNAYVEKAQRLLLGRFRLGSPTVIYIVYIDNNRKFSEAVDELWSNLQDEGVKLEIEIVKDVRKYEMIGDEYYNESYFAFSRIEFL